MPTYQNRLHELLEAYTANSINEAEFYELCELIEQGNDVELKEMLKRDLQQAPFVAINRQELDRMFNKLMLDYKEGYASANQHLNPEKSQQAPVRRIYFFRYIKWAAAACGLLFALLGSYSIFFYKKGIQPQIAKKALQQDIVAPKTTKAVITLANGKLVLLDSIVNGLVALQSNVNIVKLANGSLAYKTSTGKMLKEEQYNTLFNPRGSAVVDLTLSDGTHVWLNAGSSLTYPVAFIGKERKVTISGEAYFEVAKNAAMPFKVKKGQSNWVVEVLGTHFNVNTYDDEPATKITLLEGLVKVTSANASNTITPGQQAQVDADIKVINNIDVDNVMAWKNGQFVLEGTNIKKLMRQVSRWYNVDIVYKGAIAEKEFGGSIDRNVSLSRLIQALEENGVKCELDGNVVLMGK